MARVVALMVLMVAAAAMVSAGRVKVVPPSWDAMLNEQNTRAPACNAGADMAYRVLVWGAAQLTEYSPFRIVQKMDDIRPYAWTNPGKTLCNGADRALYLGVGVSPKDKPMTDHYFVVHTYGGGKYAMMYQSYSGSEHKNDQGKSYSMWQYNHALQPYMEGKEKTKAEDKAAYEAQQELYKGFPPVLQRLPCDCQDLANALQKALDSDNSFTIQGVYNDLFAPPSDKINAKMGFQAFGRVWQEKDFFQLYKFEDAVPDSKKIKKPSGYAFLQHAVVHGIAQRVKSPKALLHLKHHNAKKAKRVFGAADQ